MRVSQVVETDAGEIELAELPVEELVERFGVHGLPGGVGEDRISQARRVTVAPLAPLPPDEHGLGVGVEVDAPTA